MTTEHTTAFSTCIKEGPVFIQRCNATYEIAIKALQKLQSNEIRRLEMVKKEEIKKAADVTEKEEMRARIERNALRQKNILEVKKRKSEIERLTAEAKKRNDEINMLAAEADRDLASLLNEVANEKVKEEAAFKEKGTRIKTENEKIQLTKREQNAVRSAEKCLQLSLREHK